MPQRARLLYRTSDGTEQEHVLDPNEREYTIGRHPECTVTVLQQTSVSRRHARILFDGRDYTLEDLKSSNGTYLNNQRIMQTALRQGDSFRCGDLQFEFSLEGEDELLDPIPSPDPEPRRSIRPAGRLPMGAGRLSPQPRPTQMPPGRGAPRRLTPRHFERFESEEGGAYIEEAHPPPPPPPPLPPQSPQPPPLPPDLIPEPLEAPVPRPEAPILRAREPASRAPLPSGGIPRVEDPPPRLAPRRLGASGVPKPVPVGPIARATLNAGALGQEHQALRAQLDEAQRALEAQQAAAAELEAERDEAYAAAAHAREAAQAAASAALRQTQGQLEEALGLLEAAQAKADTLEAALETEQAKNSGLSDQLQEGAVGAGDQRSRIVGLEREVARLTEQLRGSSDRAIQLKEQNQIQQRQLEEYRQEKAELERALAELGEENQALHQNQATATTREGELVDTLNALKREVSQRHRELKSLQDRLDEREYDLKAIREENQTLQLALGDDASARKGLNTTVEHLRKVLAEKESMIESLQAELARAERRLEMLEGRLRDASGSNFNQLQDELIQLRAIRDELNREKQRLEDEVARLKADGGGDGGGGNHRQLMEQINELRRDARQLRQERDEARAAAAAEAHRSAPPARAASGDAEELELALEDERRDRRAAQKAKAKLEVQLKGLTQQIEALEAELQAAREGSAAPTAAATTSGDFEILYQQSVEAYEQINDLASDLRSNIDLSQSCLGDLSGLIEAAVEATQRGLDANMAQRLRVAVDEADPEWNLPSSREALEKAHSTSESFKKALIRFRKILKQYGYEG